MIAIKRAYAAADEADGFRILVDRLWPRGAKKDDLKIDSWPRELAPSDTLRRWFGHDRAKWVQFEARYLAELERAEARQALAEIAHRAEREAVTLVYAARDELHNNAVVLRSLLAAMRPTRGERQRRVGGR